MALSPHPTRVICFLFLLPLLSLQSQNKLSSSTTISDYLQKYIGKHIDRPFVLSDDSSKTTHAVWTQHDKYGSKNQKDSSFIYYAQSGDAGKTWNKTKRISFFGGNCVDGDSTVKGPNLCLGNKGELYATWASPKGLAFQKSTDGGSTWLKQEKIINPIKNGWQYVVDGPITNGLPTVACDVSFSEFRNRIYICWSDEKYGVKHKDVFLVYSDDGGENWTEPILVTYRPNHKEQFNPRMAIDKTTGYVYLLYFDKQNVADGKNTDLYLAKSKNGGLLYEYYKVNEVAHQTSALLFSNEQLVLKAFNDTITINWAFVKQKTDTVFYQAVFNDSTFKAYNKKAQLRDEELTLEKTFLFAHKIIVPFNLEKNANITAIITKPLEPKFEKLIIKNKHYLAGNNKLIIDTKALGLRKGNYILTLYYNGQNKFAWILGSE
jgi:hypothetical protein